MIDKAGLSTKIEIDGEEILEEINKSKKSLAFFNRIKRFNNYHFKMINSLSSCHLL